MTQPTKRDSISQNLNGREAFDAFLRNLFIADWNSTEGPLRLERGPQPRRSRGGRFLPQRWALPRRAGGRRWRHRHSQPQPPLRRPHVRSVETAALLPRIHPAFLRRSTAFSLGTKCDEAGDARIGARHSTPMPLSVSSSFLHTILAVACLLVRSLRRARTEAYPKSQITT
jgi:hypothetical protein